MKNTPITIDQALALTGSKALEHFTDPKNIHQLASQVRDEALALSNVFNPETKSGRDGIGSTALKVSKSKKVIIDKLDQAAAKHKEALKKITGSKKRVEDEFKKIRAEVLRPRDEWQAEQDRIESERVAGIKQRIENIRRLGDFTDNDTKEQLSDKIEVLNGIDASQGFEEFYWDATNAIKEQIARLHDRIIAVAQEAQRKEEQARLQLERDINEIKQYPLCYIGRTSDEIKDGKENLNKRSYVTFNGREEIKSAVNDANEQLDKMIEQAEQAERNEKNEPKKVCGDDLNISKEDVKKFVQRITSGNESLYYVWVDVVETTEIRRMYPVAASSEEEAKSHIEKSLETQGDIFDYKEFIVINKSVAIGDISEVVKQ